MTAWLPYGLTRLGFDHDLFALRSSLESLNAMRPGSNNIQYEHIDVLLGARYKSSHRALIEPEKPLVEVVTAAGWDAVPPTCGRQSSKKKKKKKRLLSKVGSRK
jgi:hypothetical protein